MVKKERLIFFFYSALVILLTLVSYANINKLFYVSDEWIALGGIYFNGILGGLKGLSIVGILLGRGRPLAALLMNPFFYYFTYNTMPFVITAYIFHILNGILLYLFVKKISKNQLISLTAGIFFITASVAQQTITWLPNIPQVPTATAFILLSSLFLTKFADTHKRNYLLYSILSGYIAYLFKDQYFYVFIWIPVLYVLLSGKKVSITRLLAKYWYILIGILAAVVYKLYVLFGSGILAFNSSALANWYKIIFNSLYYPFISLSQTFIPAEFMFKTAKQFLYFNYGGLVPNITNIDLIAQTIVSDLLSQILSFIFLIILAIAYFLNKPQRKTIIISLIFYVLSFTTIAVFLIGRNNSYVESRYLYTGMVSMAIFFGIFIDTVKRLLFLTKIPKAISIICILIVLILWYGKQVSLVKREVYRNVINAQNARHALDELTKTIPVLPDKPIIYLTGSSKYYGYENQYVPLQLNPGYIFMVWYYKGGKVPRELLADTKLIYLETQWYKEFGDKAFGYFWDKKQLKDVIKEKNINPTQLVGLYYDGGSRKFINITNELRMELF